MDALAGACCLLVVVLPVYLLISGALLMGGCSLYNRLAGRGSPERVPEPGLGRAVGVVLVNLLAGGFGGFVLGVVAGALGGLTRLGEDRLVLIVQLQAFPLGVIILGGLLAGMLPTTFARGVLAALSTVLLVVMIVAVLVLIFGALGLMIFLAAK